MGKQMVINLENHHDGTFTLTYFDKVVGYISKIKSYAAPDRRFRAVSVHGNIYYAGSLKGARSWLMEQYH
jgi:hypothetical protein